MSNASPAGSRPPVDTETWMRAVDEGDTSLVKSLLAAGVDVNAVSDGGKTALMRAVTKGYLDIVQVLLDAGADVNAVKENGSTALIIAVFFGYAEIVRALLAKGANPDVQTPLGTTPEKWAQSMSFTEIAELLRNADAIRAEGSRAESATTGRRLANAAGLFPGGGPIRPVVPLSEIDETSSMVLVVNTPPAQAPAAEVKARAFDPIGSRGAAPEERDDATVVNPRAGRVPAPVISHAVSPPASAATSAATSPVLAASAAPAPAARASFAPRLKSTLMSWPFTVLALTLILIAGVMLDADWKNSQRAVKTEQPAAPAPKDVQAVTEVETQAAAQPQPAPQVPATAEPRVVLGAPEVMTGAREVETTRQAERAAARSEAAAEPVVVSESRRAPVAEPAPRREIVAETRVGRTAPPAGSERDAAPRTATARQDAGAVRRAQNTEGPVSTPSAADDSWPVFSPTRAAKSEKKKVIQWP